MFYSQSSIPTENLNTIYGKKIITNNIINNKINDQPHPTIAIQMKDNFNLQQQSLFHDKIISTNYEKSPLTIAYFSNKNVELLQNEIRGKVYLMSNKQYNISPPNRDFLIQIMENIFLQYFENNTTNPKAEIIKLNNIVIEKVSNNLFSMCKSHIQFQQEQGKVVVPLDLPKQSGDRNFKQMDLTNHMFI